MVVCLFVNKWRVTGKEDQSQKLLTCWNWLILHAAARTVIFFARLLNLLPYKTYWLRWVFINIEEHPEFLDTQYTLAFLNICCLLTQVLCYQFQFVISFSCLTQRQTDCYSDLSVVRTSPVHVFLAKDYKRDLLVQVINWRVLQIKMFLATVTYLFIQEPTEIFLWNTKCGSKVEIYPQFR